MGDPFLNLKRPQQNIGAGAHKIPASATTSKFPNLSKAGAGHSTRAHSKFSASGAERWFMCPGSVELSEGRPDKDSIWSLEGTLAHEVLEAHLKMELSGYSKIERLQYQEIIKNKAVTQEMITHARHASGFIVETAIKEKTEEVLVETRIYLDFIHPEMFGTFDGAVVDVFGTLHVFDYKYGAGVGVSPKGNLQMVFYGIGLAHRYKWNFKKVRLWIIQPRIRGYDGPAFWDISIKELKDYVDEFKGAVQDVLHQPDLYVEGGHCHWCKAKSVCPLKLEKKQKEAEFIFTHADLPLIKSYTENTKQKRKL